MGLYVRRNPHQEDPGDNQDPRNRADFRLHQGIAVGIEYQKVVSYTIWLWFNQVDTCYLRMYESITALHCLHYGLNLLPDGTIDPETPFFIDGSGNATVHTHMKALDLHDFAAAAGIPGATTYVFRKMFARILMDQEDHTLREAEEWAMGHGPQTAKNAYMEDLSKKLKSCR